jgi:hypothetical protein
MASPWVICPPIVGCALKGQYIHTGHSILHNLIRTLFSKQNNLSSQRAITTAPQPYLPYYFPRFWIED